MVNKELKNYIEENVFKDYKLNDTGHNLSHIKYVIRRSLFFLKQCKEKLSKDMAYTVASYHDIGHHINAKEHEKVSADILRNDKNLLRFFNSNQIETMAQAIEDHRASSNIIPRNIYGKIVSSADRYIDTIMPFKATYRYNIAHGLTDLSEIIETSRNHLIEKFGYDGYANKKMYFEDKEYEKFLTNLQKIIYNKNTFIKHYCKINNINIKTI